MAILSIYMNSAGKVALHYTGFSWLAALSLPLWALHRHLYTTAMILVPLTLIINSLVLWFIDLLPNEIFAAILGLTFLCMEAFVAGRYANHWHRVVLRRRGYIMTSTEFPTVMSTA